MIQKMIESLEKNLVRNLIEITRFQDDLRITELTIRELTQDMQTISKRIENLKKENESISGQIQILEVIQKQDDERRKENADRTN